MNSSLCCYPHCQFSCLLAGLFMSLWFSDEVAAEVIITIICFPVGNCSQCVFYIPLTFWSGSSSLVCAVDHFWYEKNIDTGTESLGTLWDLDPWFGAILWPAAIIWFVPIYWCTLHLEWFQLTDRELIRIIASTLEFWTYISILIHIGTIAQLYFWHHVLIVDVLSTR